MKDETYYQSLDKRTKEYKEWKARHKASSEGLGDSVEKVTEATGIKKAVKFLAGEDCGCDKRKEKLNKLFSYRKPLCLKEEEYLYLSDFFNSPPPTISYRTQLELVNIYNRVFQQKKKPTSCGSCVRQVVSELKTYFIKYDV